MHCLGLGLVRGLCPGCDAHPAWEGALAGTSSPQPARGSSQVLPERVHCLGAQRGSGLHILASPATWPSSRSHDCLQQLVAHQGGLLSHLGAIVSPGYAPGCTMLCPWAPLKAQGTLMGSDDHFVKPCTCEIRI